MKKSLSSMLCVATLLLSGVAVQAVLSPASAQSGDQVSFQSFHDELAPYGDWVYSDRWGEVWVPENVADDFHPYGSDGHWVDTDEYGWTWVSDYEWGDIPFHYGRWVNDPDDGWLWIPGYVWSPAWVVWRSNGEYTGWMPMPPDDAFLQGGNEQASSGITIGNSGFSLSLNFGNDNDDYGYRRWYGRGYSDDSFASNWMFVGTGHIADRNWHNYGPHRGDYANIIHGSKNITNYTVVNNYVVNRSIDTHQIERFGGHAGPPVHVAGVFKRPALITRVDTGRQVQQHMRMQNPRGTGLAGSAPKPDAATIGTLSAHVGHRVANQPAHVFTRDTVTKIAPSTAPVGTRQPGGPVTLPFGTPPAPGGGQGQQHHTTAPGSMNQTGGMGNGGGQHPAGSTTTPYSVPQYPSSSGIPNVERQGGQHQGTSGPAGTMGTMGTTGGTGEQHHGASGTGTMGTMGTTGGTGEQHHGASGTGTTGTMGTTGGTGEQHHGASGTGTTGTMGTTGGTGEQHHGASGTGTTGTMGTTGGTGEQHHGASGTGTMGTMGTTGGTGEQHHGASGTGTTGTMGTAGGTGEQHHATTGAATGSEKKGSEKDKKPHEQPN